MSGYNLKSEEDVKEYLKNLFTEYQFGCYGEKNPEGEHLIIEQTTLITKSFDTHNLINFFYHFQCVTCSVIITKLLKKILKKLQLFIKKIVIISITEEVVQNSVTGSLSVRKF